MYLFCYLYIKFINIVDIVIGILRIILRIIERMCFMFMLVEVWLFNFVYWGIFISLDLFVVLDLMYCLEFYYRDSVRVDVRM